LKYLDENVLLEFIIYVKLKIKETRAI